MKTIDKYFKIIVVILLAYIAVVESQSLPTSHKRVSTKENTKTGRKDVAVYIIGVGKKTYTYHYDKNCDFLFRAGECISEYDAVKMGYKPCAECVKDNNKYIAPEQY